MADKLSSIVARLDKRGPHRVMVGDLDYAGLSGKVYVPAEGNGVPGVVFAHDWMTDISAYHGTLRHLASWGIAVAAPNTEKGLRPNVSGFAEDILSSLTILAGVRMGEGSVTVHPKKLCVAGHGMGASAAILAAASAGQSSVSESIDGVCSVAAIFPTEATPSPSDAAVAVEVPGLVVAPGENTLIVGEEAMRIAARWKGNVTYREIEKANQAALSEHVVRNVALGLGKVGFGSRALLRGMLTAFILNTANGEKDFSAISSDQKLKGTLFIDREDLEAELPENADILERIQDAV